mgnify:CR=1 FL=1
MDEQMNNNGYQYQPNPSPMPNPNKDGILQFLCLVLFRFVYAASLGE